MDGRGSVRQGAARDHVLVLGGGFASVEMKKCRRRQAEALLVRLCVGTFQWEKVAGADGTMQGLWTDTTVAAGKVSRGVLMLVAGVT